MPIDTQYAITIGPLKVEIVDVQLRTATNRGILAEIRTSAGPFDLTLRVVVADGDPFVAFPSHTVRGHNGRTRYLHRVRIRDEADAERFDAFILDAYHAAVDQWGQPEGNRVRSRPHRVLQLIDTIEHIENPKAAWQTLLEGLTKVIKDEHATSRELESACRMLSKLTDQEFKETTQALEALASIGGGPARDLLREVMATEMQRQIKALSE